MISANTLNPTAWQVLRDARGFAIAAHGSQFYPPDGMRSGVIRFETHLGHVVGVLSRFGCDDPILHAAAWLHDVVEDTRYNCDDILIAVGASKEGRTVVEIVRAVTDEPGSSRAERKRRTYPKLVLAGDDAITVKLADRIANVESAIAGYHGFLPTYAREYTEFEAILRPAGGDDLMWQHLAMLLDSSTLFEIGRRL